MSPMAAPHAHSQPLLLTPSQLPKLRTHELKAQVPALQVTPFACRMAVVQFRVHEPQRVTVVRRFVSQPPFPATQWPKPLAHVHVQALAAHFGVPFTVLHVVPQPPQFSGSAVVSRQRFWQQVLPFAQVLPASTSHPSTHAPAGLQSFPPVQSAVFVHSTHWCRPRSHWGAAGLIWQSLSCLQPGVHWRLALQ